MSDCKNAVLDIGFCSDDYDLVLGLLGSRIGDLLQIVFIDELCQFEAVINDLYRHGCHRVYVDGRHLSFNALIGWKIVSGHKQLQTVFFNPNPDTEFYLSRVDRSRQNQLLYGPLDFTIMNVEMNVPALLAHLQEN